MVKLEQEISKEKSVGDAQFELNLMSQLSKSSEGSAKLKNPEVTDSMLPSSIVREEIKEEEIYVFVRVDEA
jgi:hypothetical protein